MHAFVVSRDHNSFRVRGIYTRFRTGRRAVPAFHGSGLRYDSFLKQRVVRLPFARVQLVGETPIEFDPFGDFAVD